MIQRISSLSNCAHSFKTLLFYSLTQTRSASHNPHMCPDIIFSPPRWPTPPPIATSTTSENAHLLDTNGDILQLTRPVKRQ